MFRAALVSVAAIVLLACSSSDKPKATPTPAVTSTPVATATSPATATPVATQTPVAPAATETTAPQPVAAATQAPVGAPAQQPQQPAGPPPGQVACAVATGPEIQALNVLASQLLAGAPAAQQVAVRGAMAQVDRNNDGAVDAGVCRDAVVAVTLALNALRR